jgi:phosphoribosylanthranilate isomerase
MFKSYRYEFGAMYRKGVMVRLDELGLPYTEHRTLVDSVIIVKTYTKEQEAAYRSFSADVRAFMVQLHEIEMEEERQELARINRFRKLTFRKPLKRLPA